MYVEHRSSRRYWEGRSGRGYEVYSEYDEEEEEEDEEEEEEEEEVGERRRDTFTPRGRDGERRNRDQHMEAVDVVEVMTRGGMLRRPQRESGAEGILPLPPCRVALLGVDLSVGTAHIHSLVEQLVGAAPRRLSRPALDNLGQEIKDRLKETGSNGDTFSPSAELIGQIAHSVNVNHMGGMVMIELHDFNLGSRLISLLNGAKVNGRTVTASLIPG